MNKWIWPVTPENWEVVKAKKVWSTDKERKTLRVKNGDILIFYVKSTGTFKGIFQIISNWYETDEPIWFEESDGIVKFPFQCKLEQMATGEAVFNELVPNLKFITDKSYPQIFLRAHSSGPANAGKPISEDDYELILREMQEPVEPVHVAEEEETFDHDEIISELVGIGLALGFEPSTDMDQTRVSKGAVVDVVWRVRVANLGLIKYVFEVQRSGSKKSLILNLLKAMNDPTVRKLVAVSDKSQLQEIEAEIADLPEDFRKRVVMLSIEDVNHAHNLLTDLNEFKQKLGFIS